MEQQIREIPGNYCRNGSFERGNTDFWELIIGWSSYTIEPTGMLFGQNMFYGFLYGANNSLYHQDYIPVREGEEITVGLYYIDGNASTLQFQLNYYNGAYEFESVRLSDTITTPVAGEFYSYVFRVPKGMSFIRFKTVFTGGSPKWVKVSGFTINIQESSIALETKSNYKWIYLSDMSVCGPTITKQAIVQPSDPNKIYKVVHIHIWAQGIPGSTGTHDWALVYADFDSVFWARAASTHDIGWVRGDSIGTTTILTPTTDLGRQRLLESGLYASYDRPLYIQYTNNSNLNQNGGRQIELMVLETYLDKI